MTMKRFIIALASGALLALALAAPVQAHTVYEWRYMRTFTGGYVWVQVAVPHTHVPPIGLLR